jgi:hypothetical protein
MENRYFIIGIALMLLAGAVSRATATGTTTQDLHCTFSGTFVAGVETHLDTNNDGLSAGSDQGLMNCNIGRFFFQEVLEYQAPVPATEGCPEGSTLEFHLQQHHGVSTEESSDQLFAEIKTNDGILCLNESNGTFSFTGHGIITGGTGHFKGASGTFEGRSTGKYLVFGSKNDIFGGFGQFNGTNTWKLTLPND